MLGAAVSHLSSFRSYVKLPVLSS